MNSDEGENLMRFFGSQAVVMLSSFSCVALLYGVILFSKVVYD